MTPKPKQKRQKIEKAIKQEIIQCISRWRKCPTCGSVLNHQEINIVLDKPAAWREALNKKFNPSQKL